MSYLLILPCLMLHSSLQQLSASEKPETLDAYVKKFAVGEKKKSSDTWFSPDKGYHLVGSMIGTTFFGQISQHGFSSNSQESRYIGAGITFSLGLAKEIYDCGKPNNIFSWKDLTANCVGIMIGIVLLGVH